MIDSDNLEIQENRKTIMVSVARPSAPVDLACSAVGRTGKFPVWVKVYSANSLLQVVNLEVLIGRKSKYGTGS